MYEENTYLSFPATYQWLKEKGLKDMAFRFVRFNIPFYILPMVNQFVLREMGFCLAKNQDQSKILKELANTPAYTVRGMMLMF